MARNRDEVKKYNVTTQLFSMNNINRICIILFIILVIFPSPLKAEENTAIHHEMKIVLYPEEQRFVAEDSVTIPDNFPKEFSFLLHGGLEPSSLADGVSLICEKLIAGDVPIESCKVRIPDGLKKFRIKYGGTIYHSIEPYGKEQARGFRMTPGIISKEGVYLSGSSLWYPNFGGGLMTFNLEVELPSGWYAVSQGERTMHDQRKDKTRVRWISPEPQEEIYIAAAKFTEYAQSAGNVQTMVFLRSPEKELADKYLDAAVRYITMYEKLIGPYPYKKFALVENFWETGLGMPSFTLLGPKIIRFPFIINSSYPHEILHNWWGNSVYPDYRSGNWSEGLTAYLSDHLIKEQQGGGVEYRQETLQKYADYVSSGKDFPLVEFRTRHSSPSEAVGYGKSLMFFHMLRQEIGDKDFIVGLQDFYRRKKFQFASFNDLRESFENVSGKDLKLDFDQWITRRGAPQLKLNNVKSVTEGDEYILTALIEQVQLNGSYHLKIPVAVTMEGKEQAYQTKTVMNDKHLELTIHLPSKPLRIDIDPEFDLFRRLEREEIPPALTQALGAKKMLIVLPSGAEGTMLKAYQEFARVMSDAGPDKVEVKLDKEIESIPSECAVTILGWENRFLKEAMSALSGYDVSMDKNYVQINRNKILREKHTVVFSMRNAENKDMAILLVASDIADALPGLSKKLPHYQKYSYLVFEGDEPANVVKGRWPVLDSPMTVFIPDVNGNVMHSEMGALLSREPLITLPSVFSDERMMETVKFLSGDELKGRGLGTEGLNLAAEFIAKKFQEAGLKPANGKEGNFFQILKDPELDIVMNNVVGVISGKRPEISDQSVVVGAHYDHLGTGWPDVREGNRGKIHPGADDNASGVAVLIELAEVLGKNLKPDRSLIFVAFTGEEAGRKGSKYYAANQKQYPSEKCIGMVNLDTVGRLGKGKLLVLGAGSAREWTHIFRGAGFVTGVEVETVTESVDSSDNISFEEAGVPAVQLFSGPHLDYHRPTDTADKIDSQGLVKVASVAKEVIEYLAKIEKPLTSTISHKEKAEPSTEKDRKVSLGIVPNFVFKGKGTRISAVVPGSPAEKSGLKEGDIVIQINDNSVHNLKDLSNILRTLKPGNKVDIIFIRDGKEMKVESEVGER
jgi:hypothetical protein